MTTQRQRAAMALARVLQRFPSPRLEAWYEDVCRGDADFWRNAGLVVTAAYDAAGRNQAKQVEYRAEVERIMAEAEGIVWQW
jgi:hypothetical protein